GDPEDDGDPQGQENRVVLLGQRSLLEESGPRPPTTPSLGHGACILGRTTAGAQREVRASEGCHKLRSDTSRREGRVGVAPGAARREAGERWRGLNLLQTCGKVWT